MEVQISSIQFAGAIAVAQIRTKEANRIEYITGNSAISSGNAFVSEISESGSVNNLSVINDSDQHLFFMDGDILSGAKQNRVLNTSIILKPHSKTEIPVSCVERGRWNYKSKKFSANNFTAPHNLRVNKNFQTSLSLRLKKGYSTDQFSIWGEVDKYNRKYRSESLTSDLTKLYEKSQSGTDLLDSKIKKDSNSNGMAIFVNNKIVSLDIFGRSESLSEYFRKIVHSVGIEALHLPNRKDNAFNESEIRYKTFDFIDNLEKTPYEEYKSIGSGIQKRYLTDKVSGFALELEGCPVHLSLLSLIGDTNEGQ